MAGRLARSRPADDERSNRSRKRRRYDGAVGPSRAGTSTGGTGRPISSTSWEDEDEARSSDDDVDGQSTRQVARRRRRAGSSRQQQQQQYTRSLSPVKRTRGLTRQLRDRLPILDGATLFQSTKILENVSNRPSQPRRGRASTKETLARMKKQQIELNARSSESDASVDEQSDYDPMQGQEQDNLLWEADASQLRRMKKADLVRLHEAVSPADVESLSKDALVDSILALRQRVRMQSRRGSEADSPVSSRPLTSHESSPHSRSRQTFGTRTRSAKTKKERDARRAHVPTPPASETDSVESLTTRGHEMHLSSSASALKSSFAARLLEADNKPSGQTPIAFRTRRNLHGSGKKRRPSRRAKLAAVVKIAEDTQIDAAASDPPSRGHSDDDDSDDRGEEEDDEDEAGWRDTESDASNDDTEMQAVSATRTSPRLQRQSHLQKRRDDIADQLSAPSDADEESGGEYDDEDDEEEEEVETRQLRNGKTVPLRRASSSSNDQDIDDVDVDMEEQESEQESVDDVNLALATSKTLLRFTRDDLLRLCEHRHIDGHGTKRELVHALLEWRDRDFDASSTAQSPQSSTSQTSTQTTRAPERDMATSRPSSVSTPLLMRRDHSASPEKPVTSERSKAAEQEEVNALDLESLQLQDKEIPPEKLVKLEKVGSGGFKDVYKGTYRKKTIAIADIRGHLTDMDIKELGLLRDLRHPNIVHFIGVSIPKEPSSVPVMIVTELCANGDLFDYIRAVPHPPFLNMLEIMQGIAKGVEYLHTRKPAIIHRDIKSSNVLITAQGVAKINDFGLARVKNSTISKVRSVVGTVHWQAPELWSPKPRYSERVDVYSCAMVFWEVLQWHQAVKRYPFEGMNDHAIYEAVGQKNLRPSTASLSRTWGLEIMDVVTAMWNGDPSARPPMSQVVLELDLLITAEKAKLKDKKRQHH